MISRSHFDTGRSFDAMKGRLLKASAETEDGGIFSREMTIWADPPRLLRTGTNGVFIRFAHPVATVKEILERGAGAPRRLESEMEYDDYGNVTRLSDYGIVEDSNRSAFDDERIAVTEFAVNLAQWIVRSPKRQVIQDENGAAISRSEFFYDDETFAANNLGSVVIGNLTLRRDWIDPANATAYVKSTRTQYDVYGNPVRVLDPLADATGNPSLGHGREFVYDDALHTFAEREIIHIGFGHAALEAIASYDRGLGTVRGSVDFNGNSTGYRFDALGRLNSITKPGDTATYPTAEYSYALAVPTIFLNASGLLRTGLVNHVESRMLDRVPGTATARRDHYFISRQFTDGLGRTLMTRTEAEPAAGSSVPRVVVRGAVSFNARMKPAHTLNPFFTRSIGSLDELLAFENIEAPGWQGQFHASGSLVSLNLTNAHQESTRYDATLRVIQQVHADGTSRRMEFEPLVIRKFDENDNDPNSPHFNTAPRHFTDGLGRLVRVDETVRLNDDGTPSDTTQTWTTRYRYDLNGCLTHITDAQNNIKEMRYDGLQRKVWMNDPDSGASTFVYDDAANLIESVDGKGQRLSFTYDGANRVLTEDYHDESAPEFSYRRSPDVAYFYDEPADSVDQGDGTRAKARNTKGALAYVQDASGEEHISFDNRGRVAWTVKRIPDPQFDRSSASNSLTLVSFKTGFEFDSMDRITRLIYPDNDRVSYQYNARNLLERIVGGPNGEIIPAIRYLPSAQQEKIQYGNSVQTSCAYDSRLRLIALATGAPTGPELINLAYTFDAGSNLRHIQDGRPTSAIPVSDPRRNSQTFGYDDLYRLTSVQYNSTASATATNFIRYRYDRIGNMLAQTSDITHIEKERSITDLGVMGYGGKAGASNRQGRAIKESAGPHALTSLRDPKLGTQNYTYDDNGNMTDIEGLRCAWDFKDRLVLAEDDTMRAEYVYDYTGRRVLKRVWTKTSTNALPSTFSPTPETVIYVGKYFEVRQHDQPVKYVFNNDTRVARITGSLFPSTRIQRLRLYRGWNLVSLAVTASNALEQLSRSPDGIIGSAVESVFRWDPLTGRYSPVVAGQTLLANTILWVKARTNTVEALTGGYADPTNRFVSIGGSFQCSGGLETGTLARLGLTEDLTLWNYDARRQVWQFHAPTVPASDPGFPKFLAPGSVIFVQAAAATELEVPAEALRMRYYHEDHLGSSSAVTDASGALVEENAYYPFGATRHRHQPRPLEEGDYRFTQKEQDPESGLSYFGTRFLSSRLARFVRVDVLASQLPAEWLEQPQKLNSYAYVQNNPLRFVDPTGMDGEKPKTGQRVLVLYSDDLYQHFSKNTGQSRAVYENALKTTYGDEAGTKAQITVKSFRLKDPDDIKKYFKGTAYDVVIYNGHASGLAKELFPDGDVRITPDDIKEALAGAKSVPKEFYLYGCNTAKSGFARVLSEALPKTTVTGTGLETRQSWTQDSTGIHIQEDRDHNIIFNGGNETKNVRKVDPEALKNAPIQ